MKTAEKKPQLKQVIMWTGLFVTLASSVLIFLELTKPNSHAGLVMHDHAVLTYYIDGVRRGLPAGIGIDEDLWKGHTLDQYGANGSAPLHTHSMDGLVHIESTEMRAFTFGEFMDIWGLDIEGKDASLCFETKDDCMPIEDYRNHVIKNGDTLRLSID
jgi:hypothetical protein